MLVTSVFHPYVGRSPARINLSGFYRAFGSVNRNNVKKIVGCLITHEHGDHAGRINEVLNYVVAQRC